MNEIEKDFQAIPDYLWDTMSTDNFESPSNQYSMF